MVHAYAGILLSHKKEHILVSSDEVDEPGVRLYYCITSVIQTEVSQKEKNCRILTHLCGTLERWY